MGSMGSGIARTSWRTWKTEFLKWQTNNKKNIAINYFPYMPICYSFRSDSLFQPQVDVNEVKSRKIQKSHYLKNSTKENSFRVEEIRINSPTYMPFLVFFLKIQICRPVHRNQWTKKCLASWSLCYKRVTGLLAPTWINSRKIKASVQCIFCPL